MSPPPGLPTPSPPRFKAQCTHLTMARLYGFEFTCDFCRRPGPFGWVYRCTQDREDLIEHAVAHGYPTTFDDLGDVLSSVLSMRRRSAAARADRLSFLDEVTPEQLMNYRPDQIATILRQREEVHVAIAKGQDRDQASITSHVSQIDDRELPVPEKDSNRPWVTSAEKECRYMVCPRCRPGGEDRAYLSIDAIADGEIPPTSAVGYGFHVMGERPIVDAEILKSIGCRCQTHPPEQKKTYIDISSSSTMSIMELLDIQLAQSQALLALEQGDAQDGAEERPAIPSLPDPGRLKHSPHCKNLAAFSQASEVANSGDAVRPPWTPPPSPSCYGKKTATETHAVGLAAEKSISDGRSSNSLKTNQGVRKQLLMSVSSNTLRRPARLGCDSSDEDIPYLHEAGYDVGLTLPFDDESFETACKTPLEAPDLAEEIYLLSSTPPARESKRTGEDFTPEPLQVDHGVAMLEESVELGVPDIVTQV